MTFLPQEFGGAQEDSRSQLPSHDVRPLVEQQRQIAVTVDPLAMYSPITVSLVGRMASGSVSSLPPPCVTTASSGLKPSTCSASRSKKLIGISSGK